MLGSLKEKKREMDWGGESQPFKSSGSYLSRMEKSLQQRWGWNNGCMLLFAPLWSEWSIGDQNMDT